MGFTPLITIFFLAIGSPFPGQAVSVDFQPLFPYEHHRAKRQESSSQCADGSGKFLKNGDNCYYFSSDHNVALANWVDAEKHCSAFRKSSEMEVKLANLEPSNCLSNVWLMETIRAKDTEVWLGANDPGQNNQWVWNTGVQLKLENPYWGPDQPNDYKTAQHCLSTLKVGGKSPPRQYFNDQDCLATFHYVCQYKI